MLVGDSDLLEHLQNDGSADIGRISIRRLPCTSHKVRTYKFKLIVYKYSSGSLGMFENNKE